MRHTVEPHVPSIWVLWIPASAGMTGGGMKRVSPVDLSKLSCYFNHDIIWKCPRGETDITTAFEAVIGGSNPSGDV